MNSEQGIGVVQGVARFGRVPERLLKNPEISGEECRLYALLTTYDYRQEHECWPSQRTLAERLSCSERTIRRLIASLREHGAIDVVQQRRAPARIRLLADVDGTFLSGQESKTGQMCPQDRPDSSQDRPNRENAPLINDSERELERVVELTLDVVPRRVLVEDVFDFWRSETKHPRAKLDRKRRQRIEWAIDNYEPDEIADAIRGAASSPFHQGQNDNGNRYDDVSLILRDSEHLERFLDIHRHPVTQIPKAWGALTEIIKEGRYT